MKQTWNKESLLAAYPRFEAQPDFYLGRMADAEKGFADTFDKEAERFFQRTRQNGNRRQPYRPSAWLCIGGGSRFGYFWRGSKK